MGDVIQLTDAKSAILPEPVKYAAVDYVYVNDNTWTTAAAYPILQIDTLGAQLSPSQYICPELSYLWVQHYCRATVAAGGKFTPLSVAPKGFPFPHIDSVSVRLNGTVCTNQQSMLGLVNNWQYLRRWSDSKLKIAGSTFMYSPPTRDSGQCQATRGAALTTITNCTNNEGTPTPYTLSSAPNQPGAYYNQEQLTTASLVASTQTVTTGTAIVTTVMAGGTIEWQDGSTTDILEYKSTSTFTIVPILAANKASQIAIIRWNIVGTVGTIATAVNPNSTTPPLNVGLYERCKMMTLPGSYISTGAAPATATISPFQSTTVEQSLNINYYNPGAANTTTDNCFIYNMLYPLTALGDVFAARGLMRDRIQMQINFNDCVSSSGTVTNPLPVVSGSFCPIIVTKDGLSTMRGSMSNFRTGINAQTRLYLKVVTLPIGYSLPRSIQREYMDFQVANNFNNYQVNRLTQFQVGNDM